MQATARRKKAIDYDLAGDSPHRKLYQSRKEFTIKPRKRDNMGNTKRGQSPLKKGDGLLCHVKTGFGFQALLII